MLVYIQDLRALKPEYTVMRIRFELVIGPETSQKMCLETVFQVEIQKTHDQIVMISAVTFSILVYKQQ